VRLCFCAPIVFSVVFMVTAPVMGSDSGAADAVEPLSRDLVSPEAVAQLLIGLGVVVAAIFFVAWLLRRIGAVSVNNGQLKVVAGLALGQRERVLLVQVGDKHQVLLGVTQGRISKLSEFDVPVVDTEASGGEFSERLRGALKGQSERRK